MMKKKLILILSIVLLVCVAGAVLFLLTVSDQTIEALKVRGMTAWGWIEKNVLSDMLATAALVGLASLELIPAIKSLLKARNAFHKVAEDAEGYTVAKIEYDARMEAREQEFYARMKARDEALASREDRLQASIEEFKSLAEGYNKNLIASEERLAKVLHHVEICADKTERMVYLGLSNSCELVKNGTARKIAEVEEHEE